MGLVGYYYILTSGAITSPTTRLGFKADESAVKEGNHGYCTAENSMIDFICLTYLVSLTQSKG